MRQHPITLSALVLLSLATAGCSKDGVSPGEVSGNVARAALVGADQAKYGEVIVAQGDNGLIVNIKAKGMPAISSISTLAPTGPVRSKQWFPAAS